MPEAKRVEAELDAEGGVDTDAFQEGGLGDGSAAQWAGSVAAEG